MKNELTITKYSDKNFLVQGNYEKFSKTMKKFQAKWNSRLKSGPGWLIPLENESDFKSHFKIVDEISSKYKPSPVKHLSEKSNSSSSSDDEYLPPPSLKRQKGFIKKDIDQRNLKNFTEDREDRESPKESQLLKSREDHKDSQSLKIRDYTRGKELREDRKLKEDREDRKLKEDRENRKLKEDRENRKLKEDRKEKTIKSMIRQRELTSRLKPPNSVEPVEDIKSLAQSIKSLIARVGKLEKN